MEINWKKVIITGLGLLAGGAATVLGNMSAEEEMKKTVAKEVAKYAENQAKGS